MHAERTIRDSGRIERRGGSVIIDFRGCDSHELSSIYEAFALLCVSDSVHVALLRAGDEDPDLHYTLRDVLATVVRIVGIRVRFRLALVARSAPIENVYAAMQGDLRALGCDARTFRSERTAYLWLRGGQGARKCAGGTAARA